MATIQNSLKTKEIVYPTSDGRPMAETDLHRDLMFALIGTLRAWYAPEPSVYVSGNLLIYYEEGDNRRHLAPDVFVVKGVPNHHREFYQIWKEGKSPDAAIEVTSKTTRREDTGKKKLLYRDRLRVPEYFMFDPRAEYLKPSLQGFRLDHGEYEQIELVEGRLPSEVLGLHLERSGTQLRLWNPATARWLPTPDEITQNEKEGRLRAEEDTRKEKEERLRAEEDTRKEKEERLRAEEDTRKEKEERLRAEEDTRKEKEERLKAEEEIARLRAQLTQTQRSQTPPPS